MLSFGSLQNDPCRQRMTASDYFDWFYSQLTYYKTHTVRFVVISEGACVANACWFYDLLVSGDQFVVPSRM